MKRLPALAILVAFVGSMLVAAAPTVSSAVASYLRTSSGTVLSVAAISDTQCLTRSGTTIAGATCGGAPSGAAGGDLSGTYPNPGVARVAGTTPGAGGLAVLDDASTAAVLATVGGQAADADLTTWAGLTPTAYFQTLIDDTTAAATRTTLGAGQLPVSSASAPGVGDDSGDGYAVGQLWVETTGDVPYVLTDSTLGAAVWRSVLPVESYEIRLTSGSWYAYPQAWTGSAWVDVGAGMALTVETAGGATTATNVLTVASGLTNSTQPHTSQYEAYIALSSLTIWSGSTNATYRIEMSETSMATSSDFARWGWALAAPTGDFDASGENVVGGRYGRNTGSSVWTWTYAAGTGTWTSVYSDASAATYRHVAFWVGVARGMAYATGGAAADAAFAPSTTAPTRLYVLAAGSGVTTATVDVTDPRVRITRLPGSP